ncbi:MAG TPA: 30S ribosomal protein S17e [Candidatus Woesearchaeota archaeon]|nr:30S ribosomal protein S17e [Candidatus Woesearchaeota archaeon]
MGRIRTTYIKRTSRQLLGSDGDKFSKEFKKNKKVMNELAEIPSKVIRNKIAGCITFLKKNQEED